MILAIPISRPRGELQNLLVATYPKTRLDDVVLRPQARARLDRLVDQQRQRDRLRAFGRLEPIGSTGSTLPSPDYPGQEPEPESECERG
jgi:hypothetical protein